MQTKLINEVRTIMHDTVETIKHECLTECRAKNQKIQALEKQICLLEEKLDATEAYERRDTVIISGSVPGVVNSEVTSNLVVDLMRKKFPTVEIQRSDISVSHRLQSKRPNSQGVTFAPNICGLFLKIRLICTLLSNLSAVTLNTKF